MLLHERTTQAKQIHTALVASGRRTKSGAAAMAAAQPRGTVAEAQSRRANAAQNVGRRQRQPPARPGRRQRGRGGARDRRCHSRGGRVLGLLRRGDLRTMESDNKGSAKSKASRARAGEGLGFGAHLTSTIDAEQEDARGQR